MTPLFWKKHLSLFFLVINKSDLLVRPIEAQFLTNAWKWGREGIPFSSFEKLYWENVNPIFLPENIFWCPEWKTVSKNWQPIWEKSLHLGLSLLRTSFHYDPEWFKTFRQQLENLREEVGSNLFMGEREESTNIRQALPEESEAIYGILMKILKKWRPEIGEKKEDLEEAETITISLKDLKKVTLPVQEELEETVILSRKGLKKEPFSEKKELKKTVILSPEGLKKESPPEKVKKAQEVLPETAIISPQGTDKDDLPSSPRSLSKEPGEKDKLKHREMNIKKPDEQDFLTETVILKPEKAQGKDNDDIKG